MSDGSKNEDDSTQSSTRTSSEHEFISHESDQESVNAQHSDSIDPGNQIPTGISAPKTGQEAELPSSENYQLLNENQVNSSHNESGVNLAEQGLPPADSQGTTPAPAPNGIRGRLFGTKKKILIWVFGALALVVIVVGALWGGNFIREQIEARNAAVVKYESATSDYQESWRMLSKSITDGDAQKMNTSAEMVADASVLKGFESALASAAKTQDSSEEPGEIELDPLSTGEILDLSATLVTSASFLDQAAANLTSSIVDLDATIEEKARLVEEARLAAEEKARKKAADRISYQKLARAAESAAGKYYRFEGKIIQDAGSGTYRVSITKDQGYSLVFWEDPIMISVDGDTKERLLEDDIISFVGMSLGIQSYESIFGESIEVPLVSVDGSDVKITGHDD